MRKILLRLFGIPDFWQQISGLQATINSLQNDLTKQYEKSEQVFLFLNNIATNEKIPWFEDENVLKDHGCDVRNLAYTIRREQNIQFARDYASLKIHKIFHGGCLGCLSPAMQGIGICLKCKYLMGLNSGYGDLSNNEKH